MKNKTALTIVFAALLSISAAWAQTIPSGTQVSVRVNESLSSDKVKVGDRFTGVLTEPLVVNGQALFPRNSDVEGQVVRVVDSGRLSRPGELELKLTSVRSGNTSAALNTQPWILKGASHTKSNVTKIGGGAAAGAIIGAIAGGGKGAAIGAGVGAAAGTGVAVATGKKPATIESEALLAFTTSSSTSVLSNSRSSRPRRDGSTRDSGTNYNDGYNSTPGNAAVGSDGDYRVLSARDRDEITRCYSGGRSGLPPGLAKKDRLPPGLERQLQKNGKLPPGLQKKVRPLSSDCQTRLPRLPGGWERVILGDRVMVLDPAQTIIDLFRMSLN
ncbi:MAG TPA: hypothetical protein VM009_06675 [Terriglobales bacterium]|nr:hypothetical protein [Terriglobales bacterium]